MVSIRFIMPKYLWFAWIYRCSRLLQAVVGLARCDTVKQIISKLPLFTDGQLQRTYTLLLCLVHTPIVLSMVLPRHLTADSIWLNGKGRCWHPVPVLWMRLCGVALLRYLFYHWCFKPCLLWATYAATDLPTTKIVWYKLKCIIFQSPEIDRTCSMFFRDCRTQLRSDQSEQSISVGVRGDCNCIDIRNAVFISSLYNTNDCLLNVSTCHKNNEIMPCSIP